MFFFKKENETPKRFVAVLGTSPLAKFLTYILQENNIDVVSLLNKEKNIKEESCVFKNNIQNQSFSFKTCNKLSRKPECCFLASSFDEYKNDLLMLSDGMLKGVKVVNFASFYNHEVVKQLAGINEVRAYFDSWLVKDKKDLILLSRTAEITLCQKEDNEDYKDIESLLFNKKVEIKLRKDSSKMFWQKVSSWFLGNLLVLAYNNSIANILLDSNVRKKVDEIIKEIARILANKDIDIDTQVLLTDIYAFPDDFLSEYSSPRGCLALIDMFAGVDRFECPNLFELIGATTKKY